MTYRPCGRLWKGVFFMKLYNIENVEEFMSIVDKCKGTVELVSKEGDRLNLK